MQRIDGLNESRELVPLLERRDRPSECLFFRPDADFRYSMIVEDLHGARGSVSTEAPIGHHFIELEENTHLSAKVKVYWSS